MMFLDCFTSFDCVYLLTGCGMVMPSAVLEDTAL